MEEPVLEGRPLPGQDWGWAQCCGAPCSWWLHHVCEQKNVNHALWLTRFEAYIISGEGEFPSVDSLIPGYA